jgi:hypothetical protein
VLWEKDRGMKREAEGEAKRKAEREAKG